MDRLERALNQLTRGVEVMAGLCLAIVTVVIFASAIGRYLFAYPIPDSFDIARLLLGITVMWGFAVLGFSGRHITVDLLAEAVRPAFRPAIDVFAQAVLLLFSVLLAWKIFSRLASAYASHEATFDLRLPVWPFIGIIWIGALMAVAMALLRFGMLAAGRQASPISPSENIHD
jgi:TRAP-type C4-dicarboxylate transport system, small permease component